MADSNSLKIMCLFEAASSLGYSSELTCLGAHLYHRFFRVNKQTSLFELYMFGAASLELAHMAYEKRFVAHDLCLVMADILHGQELFIDAEQAKKLRNSMELAVRIMWSHLNETINFKDTRMITPGQLQELYREKDKELSSSRRSLPIEIDLDHESSSSSSGDEDNEIETKSDRLLLKNDPFKISSHRYLVHYLKIIKSFIEPEAMDIFVKLSNVAWAFLCDCHWSSCVTRILYNHLACASLMMAIEVFRPQLERSRQKERIQLWKSLNKNWNYIFCDDFNANHLARAQNLIVEQYNEYDRVVQYELNTFVT